MSNSAPSPRKRTLQIRLGRPKPSSDSTDLTDDAASAEKAHLRVSLKRKASISEHQPSRPSLRTSIAEQDDEDEDAVNGDGSINGYEEDEDDDDEDDEDEDAEDYQAEQQDETDPAGSSLQRTAAGPSAGTSRRPIKKLRAKGLYDALPKLIDNLIRRDSYKFFCEPVNPEEVPGYLDVIQEPMDFGTMQQKVEARQYSHMDQFKAHFALVIRNAQTFNPPGSLYYNEAKRLGSWGTRAIEREGMAVNDNGRAGVKARRAAPQILHQPEQAVAHTEQIEAQSSPAPPRYSLNVGIEAVMSAARMKPHARQRAAAALGLTTGALAGRGSTQPTDMDDEDGLKGEDDDLDDDDSEDDRHDARASVVRDSRERSQTLDVGGSSNRFGSSQPGGTPSTPVGFRQASPDALRKRLAAVTGTSMQTVSSPLVLGPTKPSKHFKVKQRLSVPGTPKRLAAGRSTTGSTTPMIIAEQTAAALTQLTSAQSSSWSAVTFDDDGSINPESIEDLQSYITLQTSARPILMPAIESLHPVAFVPNEYSGKVTTAGKAGDDADDDDDEDGKGDSKDKGDKDPLASLPTPRPGAPDALYTAVAPQPEELSSNFSHDLEALPPNLRNLPFHVPSGQALRTNGKAARIPLSWINDAYEEALRNDRKPKKQRDREREKEREMLEDWTYFRPRLARMLELSDLGPMSMLMTQNADGQHSMSTDLLAPHRLAHLRTEMQKKANSTTTASRVRDLYLDAVRQSRSLTASERQVVSQVGSDVVGDLVYGGVMGKAYCRSLTEFVAGAVSSPFLTDELDDARGRAQQAEEDRLDAVIQALAEEAQNRPTSLDGKVKEMGSRRGPFLWRDTTEEVASPSEEMREETRSPTPEQGSVVPSEPAAAVQPELQPLDRGLVQLVEENIVRRLTGSTVDVLHLVAAHLNSNGCPTDAEDALRRLHQIHAHPLEGGVSATQPDTLPFANELSWLKEDSSLTKLLDEARQDIDSLGSIIKYVVNNA